MKLLRLELYEKYYSFLIILLIAFLDWALKLYFYYQDNYYINPGIFFGTAKSHIMVGFLLSLIGITSWLVFFLWKIRQASKAIFFGSCLILYGGMSNFCDRLIFQGVIDYIHFGQISIFNLADILICLGIIILIFSKR
ncbi:MAG: signal peptidase II [bacterium]